MRAKMKASLRGTLSATLQSFRQAGRSDVSIPMSHLLCDAETVLLGDSILDRVRLRRLLRMPLIHRGRSRAFAYVTRSLMDALFPH